MRYGGCLCLLTSLMECVDGTVDGAEKIMDEKERKTRAQDICAPSAMLVDRLGEMVGLTLRCSPPLRQVTYNNNVHML